MHDFPPVFGLEENKRLTATPLSLLPILHEGRVLLIGGNADVSEYVDL